VHRKILKFIGTDGLRYLLAGSLAFLVEYASFYALYAVGHWQLYASNTVSFGCGLIVSFTLNRGWAFKKDNFHKAKHHQMFIFLLLAALNLLMTNVVIGLFKYQGIDPRFGKVLTMILIVSWNFLIFRYIIFPGQKHPE
jgi:putative flippase GtrA